MAHIQCDKLREHPYAPIRPLQQTALIMYHGGGFYWFVYRSEVTNKRSVQTASRGNLSARYRFVVPIDIGLSSPLIRLLLFTLFNCIIPFCRQWSCGLVRHRNLSRVRWAPVPIEHIILCVGLCHAFTHFGGNYVLDEYCLCFINLISVYSAFTTNKLLGFLHIEELA